VELRYYQRDAIDAVYSFLRNRDGNPCVVVPTGGGKTPIIATIIHDAVTKWGGRVLLIAHRKELLEQAQDKLLRVDPKMDVGIYSAGLNQRKKNNAVILGGIQSIYNKACDLGAFNLILIDEAHLIPPSGEGMFQQFLTDCKVINPKHRVIGLTATPYRMTTGPLCGPDCILTDVCYEVGILELIQNGFLCPLVSKCGHQTNTSGLHQRNGEFISAEANELMMSILATSVADLVNRTKDRHSTLVFSQGVEHAKAVHDLLQKAGRSAEVITGETIPRLRDLWLNEFKRRQIQYLVNVDVLTTGFDATNIDAVALMRPTLSPGLYYQMVGRGLRIDPGKSNCLVLDYGGNIETHGPIDCIITPDKRRTGGGDRAAIDEQNLKLCPSCKTYVDKAYEICPECEFSFKRESDSKEVKHETRPADHDILSDGKATQEEHEVTEVVYTVHTKRNDPYAPQTMKVEYFCGIIKSFAEWICIEHTGFARQKAEHWWRNRSRDPFPQSAEHAVMIAEAGGLADCVKIIVETKPGDKFPRIVGWEIGEIPDPSGVMVTIDDTSHETTLADYNAVNLDDVPF